MKTKRASPIYLALASALFIAGAIASLRIWDAKNAAPSISVGPSCETFESPRIHQFGYDNDQSGTVDSCIGTQHRFSDTSILPESSSAFTAQALVIDVRGSPQLVYLKSRSIVIDQSLGNTGLPPIKIRLDKRTPDSNSATPVYVPEFESLYSIAYNLDAKTDEYSNRLLRYDFKTGKAETFNFEWDEIDGVSSKLRRLLRCRTSVAYAKNHLLVGCSLVRSGAGDVKSPADGLGGGILIIPLNDRGDLVREPSRFKFVFPAGIEKRDTAIWMSGAAGVSHNGHVLFTTGNGKIDPPKGYFGCSVVAVDPFSGKIHGSVTPPLLEEDSKRAVQLCEEADQDLSGSGITRLFAPDGSALFASNGKDGVFRVFNEAKLYGREGGIYRWVQITGHFGHAFGKPAAWLDENGDANWFVALSDESGWHAARLKWNFQDRSLDTIWQVEHKGTLNRTNPLVLMNNNKARVALVSRFSAVASEQRKSELLMLNMENGEILDSKEFSEEAHFSMPTVFKNKVFVPSLSNGDNGVHVFTLKSL